MMECKLVTVAACDLLSLLSRALMRTFMTVNLNLLCRSERVRACVRVCVGGGGVPCVYVLLRLHCVML